jgi:xyloglucan-specific endo-beta-1,4-glucanase
LASYGGLWPISRQGRPLETVTLAGHKFDLHFGYNGAMKVYSFVAAKGPIFDFSADVLDFFRHLERNHGFPMRDQYMLSM